MSSDVPRRPVLLVEDNPVDLDLTLRAFRRRKLANPLLVARDGEEALAWLSRWEAGEPLPVVALLDVKLPRIGGLEVLKAWRAREVSRCLPVVALSSSAEESDIRQAYDLGVNSYLVKPVDFTRFQQRVAEIDHYWCVLNTPPE
jgi:hypothetical protein